MANLLRIEKDPPFKWKYAWLPEDDGDSNKASVEAKIKQPDTTRLKWDAPETGRGGQGRTREVSADIVPDQGTFGCE